MRLILKGLLFVSLSLLAFPATAQSWSATGKVAEICPTGTTGPCAQITCDDDGQVYLYLKSPELLGSGRRTIDIPGEGSAWSDPASDLLDALRFEFKGDVADTVNWFKSGSRFIVSSGSFERTYSLKGSSSTIGAVQTACAQLARENVPAPDPFGGASYRSRDEAEAELAVGTIVQGKFQLRSHTDLPGFDLRSGITDPALADLTPIQCETLCLVTEGCTAFTVNNGDGSHLGFPYYNTSGVCFLKASPTLANGFGGAVSGEMVGTWKDLPAPPTRGPGLTVRADAAPGQGEDAAAFANRLRAMSKPIAGECDNERSRVEALAENFAFQMDADRLNVGEAITVSWSGNDLHDRIPVWAMVSVDRPVRFDGAGFFALGPDSPNPFAIEAGMGAQRALSALHARGTSTDGAVTIAPLEANDFTVTVQLVAYLRHCEIELVFAHDTRRVSVAPGGATVVLPDNMPNGDTLYTVTLDGFDRIVRFNETRIRILHTNGSEILNRAGIGVSFSPTTRFFSTVHNDKLDIVDVIDGATVVSLNIGELSWGLGDAVVMSNVVPWGKVSLVSTLGGPLQLMDQLTGPSCCPATPEESKVMISLENASFAVWGRLGHYLGSLQAPGYRHAESPGGGYSSSHIGTAPLFELVFASMGPVAPISLGNGFDVAGGLKQTFSYDDMLYSETGVHRLHAQFERIVAKLEASGLDWSSVTQTDATDENELTFQLDRLGVALREMTQGDVVLENAESGGYKINERVAENAPLVEPFGAELRAAGWDFDWSDASNDPIFDGECYHMDLNQTIKAGSKPYVVRDISHLSRVETATSSVWLSQAWCTAGSTLGSLRPTTAFYLFDIAEGPPEGRADTFRETAFFFENNARPLWIDHPFDAKADADFVLLYAPGKARAAVYDRKARAMVRTFVALPDGDLMVDAHLTSDSRMLVQENADGSFLFHRLVDGKTVLTGRVTDGEVAVWTEDFRYDATAEAASLVDLKFVGLPEQFSLDRFATGIRAPGLARQVAVGETPAPVAPLTLPPALSGTIVADEEAVVLDVAFDPRRPALSLEVYQEGVLTESRAVADLDGELRLERTRGARWISVLARDAVGVASNSIIADIGPDPRGSGIIRGLLVGVDLYDDTRLADLNYAKSDVGRVYEALASDAVGAQDIVVLTKSKVTPEAILEAASDLVASLGPEDHGVLFFAGHGLQDREGRFYFATPGTDLDNLAATALTWKKLAETLAGSQGRITVLLDACHSGAADAGAFASNDDAVAGLTSIPANVTILSASKGREVSVESSALGGGAFSVGIERVLLSERARYDTNANGVLERSEFYIGLKTEIEAMPDVQQTPWMTNTRLVGDYALF